MASFLARFTVARFFIVGLYENSYLLEEELVARIVGAARSHSK